MKVGLNYYALRLLNPVHNIYNIDVHVQLSYTWAYAGGVGDASSPLQVNDIHNHI